MLNTVRPTATAVWIVPGMFRCTSVDPEGTAQGRTLQYIIVGSTKFRSKVLGVSFTQYLRMGFGTSYNYVLERFSEYTVVVPQSSAKGGELCVYSSPPPFSTCVLLNFFLFYLYSNHYHMSLSLI